VPEMLRRAIRSASLVAPERSAMSDPRLAALAEAHGAIGLFGHGMLNTLIARALRRSDWNGRGSARAYWGRVTLRAVRQTRGA
jgi:hypothetical protein